MSYFQVEVQILKYIVLTQRLKVKVQLYKPAQRQNFWKGSRDARTLIYQHVVCMFTSINSNHSKLSTFMRLRVRFRIILAKCQVCCVHDFLGEAKGYPTVTHSCVSFLGYPTLQDFPINLKSIKYCIICMYYYFCWYDTCHAMNAMYGQRQQSYRVSLHYA